MLFTHRGISGPAILQISSYWQAGHDLQVNLMPARMSSTGWDRQRGRPDAELKTVLGDRFPSGWPSVYASWHWEPAAAANITRRNCRRSLNACGVGEFHPSGTEGYRTAEVTLGGVNTDELSSTTMESKKVRGLYFIGEVVDVTGHLGGFNFQWAWASGHAAGRWFELEFEMLCKLSMKQENR